MKGQLDAELALIRADMDDLGTARRAALRGVGVLSAATAVLLPMLLASWGPVFIALTAVWVLGLAGTCARYISLSCDAAARVTELEALLRRPTRAAGLRTPPASRPQ